MAAVIRTFGVFFLLLLPFAHGYVENTDAEASLHAANAFWLRGDFGFDSTARDATSFEKYAAAIISHPQEGTGGMTGRNGKQYVWFPVGHQLLLVPCVAVGDLLERLWPQPGQALVALRGEVHGRLFWARFLASLLPIAAAAASTVVLLALARTLGGGERDALWTLGLACASSQLLAQAPMTTADLPGAFALLLMGLCAVRYARDAGSAGTLAVAGLSGGWAVLIRYPHAVPVALLGAWIAWVALRRRDHAGLLVFAAAALPEVVILLLANLWRFGNVFETGYSRGANAGTAFAVWFGVPLLLLAPGKGLLWFMPTLWLVLTGACRRALRVPAAAIPGIALLLVLLLHGSTTYWGGGQCYGVRYLTGPAVLFLAPLLALGRPWRTRPRLCQVLGTVGLLVALGGLVTPYRGQQELALAAAGAAYPQAPPEQRHNPANVDPRFSPLHSHWIYAVLSVSGALDRGSETDAAGAMFGVTVRGHPKPSLPEDIRLRHWWPFYLGLLLGFSGWWIALPLWLLGGFLFTRWFRSRWRADPADSSGNTATPACSSPP